MSHDKRKVLLYGLKRLPQAVLHDVKQRNTDSQGSASTAGPEAVAGPRFSSRRSMLNQRKEVVEPKTNDRRPEGRRIARQGPVTILRALPGCRKTVPAKKKL